MSRQVLPFVADDMSAFARALRRELSGAHQRADGAPEALPAPSHLALLNMLARSAGYRNFQHFRAQQGARERLDEPRMTPAEPAPDYVKVERIARHFDAAGRLVRWPGKFGDRTLCLWVLWSRIEARRAFSEAQVNTALQAGHLFGDHALLRRELCDRGLMRRTPDGREYRRIEQAPPVDARALIAHLASRAAA
jgi:hypothetical protein